MSTPTGGASHAPNILIIITDQDRATQHYPAGWEEKYQPNLTLLKQNGVSYDNAFCNTCMCSPSRSTLLTSLYPAQHGVKDTLTYGSIYSPPEPTLDPSTPNLATMMRGAYRNYYRGKWHLNKGGQNHVHPEKSLMRADIALYGFEGWVPPDAGEDVKLENCGGGFANHDAEYIAQTIQAIKEHQTEQEARVQQGLDPQPFFMIVSLVNPHDVLTYPDTYIQAGYSDDDLVNEIPLPASSTERLVTNFKPSAHWLQKVGALKGLGGLTDPKQQLAYINFYGNLQSLVDSEIGKLLDMFYDGPDGSGERTPTDLGRDTVIIKIADHGEMGMAHGGMRQKAYNTYEETIRIPMVFSNPVLFNKRRGQTDNMQLISLIDMMPTLAGMVNTVAGKELVKVPDGAKGVDMSPSLFNNSDAPIQTSVMFTYDDIRAGQTGSAEPIPAADRLRSIRSHKWKYAHYFRADSAYKDEFELYFLVGVHTEDELSQEAIDAEKALLKQHYEDNMDDSKAEQFLTQYLRRYPYEYVNLAYPDNPLVQDLPKGVQAFVARKRVEMAALLKQREHELLRNDIPMI